MDSDSDFAELDEILRQAQAQRLAQFSDQAPGLARTQSRMAGLARKGGFPGAPRHR